MMTHISEGGNNQDYQDEGQLIDEDSTGVSSFEDSSDNMNDHNSRHPDQGSTDRGTSIDSHSVSYGQRQRSTSVSIQDNHEYDSPSAGPRRRAGTQSNDRTIVAPSSSAGNHFQVDHQQHAHQVSASLPQTNFNHLAVQTVEPTLPIVSSTITISAASDSWPASLSTSNHQQAAILPLLASIHSLHPQADLELNTRFMLMPSNDQIRELQTVIRDKATSRGDFKFYADRLIRLVVEEGLNQLPIEEVNVRTPTGNVFHGIRYSKGNCGVSIVRSGESMEQGLRDCCRSIRIGKILIESDENNQARVLYAKFPNDIAERKILLLYPIMSTGLAVMESVKVLLNYGVREENLILLNLFSSPRAARMINNSFPKMFALTSDINSVCPNHFGQRYFGTD